MDKLRRRVNILFVVLLLCSVVVSFFIAIVFRNPRVSFSFMFAFAFVCSFAVSIIIWGPFVLYIVIKSRKNANKTYGSYED